jgi:hypothetical protein
MTGKVRTYDGSTGKILDFDSEGFFNFLGQDVVGGAGAITVGDKCTYTISGVYYARTGDQVLAKLVTKI